MRKFKKQRNKNKEYEILFNTHLPHGFDAHSSILFWQLPPENPGSHLHLDRQSNAFSKFIC